MQPVDWQVNKSLLDSHFLYLFQLLDTSVLMLIFAADNWDIADEDLRS